MFSCVREADVPHLSGTHSALTSMTCISGPDAIYTLKEHTCFLTLFQQITSMVTEK